MKIGKWIVVAVGMVLVAVVGFLFYMGLFSTYPVSEETVGPFTYVYDSFVGPYSETGPVFDRVYKAMEKVGVPATSKGIGIYYDDPRQVAADKLRSDCGVVIEEKVARSLSPQSIPYRIGAIPAGPALVVRFPIRNNLSYMIGPQKGYPALAEAAKRKGYQVSVPYELYDMDTKTILFVLPIKERATAP